MITGCLIGESLRVGAVFAPDNLRILKITRLDQSSTAAPSQPQAWTVIDFESDDQDADSLARQLAASLAVEGGWYADFSTDTDQVVIFADKVFRYQKGDERGRAAAVAYGRTVGVPDHQLDWAD